VRTERFNDDLMSLQKQTIFRYQRNPPDILVLFKPHMECVDSFFFIKVSSIKFHVNLSSSSQADICGQADGYGEGNTPFSRLFESA